MATHRKMCYHDSSFYRGDDMLDGITLEQLGAIAWHIQRGDNVLNITSTHTVDGDMDYISIHLRTGDVYNYNTDGTDRHDV